MSDNKWITDRISKASKIHPGLNLTVTNRMEELVQGELSERQLTKTELKKVAAQLLSSLEETLRESEKKR